MCPSRSDAFVELIAAPGSGNGEIAPVVQERPVRAKAADVAEPLELILRGGQRVRVPVRRLVDALEAR